MNIETGTIGGKAAVEVGKDMIVTSTVKGIETIGTGVGAAVQVLTATRTAGEEEMMRSEELEADHLIGLNPDLFIVLYIFFFSYHFSDINGHISKCITGSSWYQSP